MRDSDASFPDVGGQPVVPATSGSAETPPIETVPEVSSNAIVPESEGQLTNRLLLQRRMPSRGRIQAIIDRRDFAFGVVQYLRYDDAICAEPRHARRGRASRVMEMPSVYGSIRFQRPGPLIEAGFSLAPPANRTVAAGREDVPPEPRAAVFEDRHRQVRQRNFMPPVRLGPLTAERLNLLVDLVPGHFADFRSTLACRQHEPDRAAENAKVAACLPDDADFMVGQDAVTLDLGRRPLDRRSGGSVKQVLIDAP